MKELLLPLEEHNIFKFHASTCPKGVKYFFEENNYLLLKNLFDTNEKFNLIEKKISNAIMKSVYLSFNGDYQLICQTEGDSKIVLDNQFYLLEKGDGFFFVKNKFNFKIQKKIFSNSSTSKLFFSE